MSLALSIDYSDPSSERVYHPFAFQNVLRRSWWPLAKRLNLPLLQKLECLIIKQRNEAEELVAEFQAVKLALQTPETAGVDIDDASYMLKRISQVEPLIQRAIQNWEKVDCISL